MSKVLLIPTKVVLVICVQIRLGKNFLREHYLRLIIHRYTLNLNRLRAVRESELELLREVSIKTFVDAFSDQNTPSDMEMYLEDSRNMDQVIKEFNDPNVALFFSCQADDITGFMKINMDGAQTENLEESSVELERIYLLESYQGQGIGQLMMEHFEDFGRKLGVEVGWLGVWEHNPRAIAFYERQGYRVFDEHDYPLGTDIQRDLLMKKRL